MLKLRVISDATGVSTLYTSLVKHIAMESKQATAWGTLQIATPIGKKSTRRNRIQVDHFTRGSTMTRKIHEFYAVKNHFHPQTLTIFWAVLEEKDLFFIVTNNSSGSGSINTVCFNQHLDLAVVFLF